MPGLVHRAGWQARYLRPMAAASTSRIWRVGSVQASGSSIGAALTNASQRLYSPINSRRDTRSVAPLSSACSTCILPVSARVVAFARPAGWRRLAVLPCVARSAAATSRGQDQVDAAHGYSGGLLGTTASSPPGALPDCGAGQLRPGGKEGQAPLAGLGSPLAVIDAANPVGDLLIMPMTCENSAPAVGIEPTTCRLTAGRSAD